MLYKALELGKMKVVTSTKVNLRISRGMAKELILGLMDTHIMGVLIKIEKKMNMESLKPNMGKHM